jgi:hypothetical protein
MPTAEVVIKKETAIIPDVSSLTLDSFGTLPDSEKQAADVLSLADVGRFLDLRDMSIGLAMNHWPEEDQTGTLADFPFLSNLTLAEVATMTNSYDVEIEDFPVAETVLRTFLNNPVLAIEKKLTLAQVLDRYPEIGSYKLSFLNLSEYEYDAIPRLIAVPIMAIPGWTQLSVAQVPGVRHIDIHQDTHLDGEIVELTTEPKKGRIAIELKDSDGSILTWSEDPSKGLIPFGSYSITPELAGKSIAVSAYFLSCDQEGDHCKRIGPFAHPSYKKGASFYVSEADWAFAEKKEGGIVGFSREVSEPKAAAAVKKGKPDALWLIPMGAIGGSFFLMLGFSIRRFFIYKKRRDDESSSSDL